MPPEGFIQLGGAARCAFNADRSGLKEAPHVVETGELSRLAARARDVGLDRGAGLLGLFAAPGCRARADRGLC